MRICWIGQPNRIPSQSRTQPPSQRKWNMLIYLGYGHDRIARSLLLPSFILVFLARDTSPTLYLWPFPSVGWEIVNFSVRHSLNWYKVLIERNSSIINSLDLCLSKPLTHMPRHQHRQCYSCSVLISHPLDHMPGHWHRQQHSYWLSFFLCIV